MPITIVPVHAQDGLTEFVNLPSTLYGDDPSWIPPLRQQVLHELSEAECFCPLRTAPAVSV